MIGGRNLFVDGPLTNVYTIVSYIYFTVFYSASRLVSYGGDEDEDDDVNKVKVSLVNMSNIIQCCSLTLLHIFLVCQLIYQT